MYFDEPAEGFVGDARRRSTSCSASAGVFNMLFFLCRRRWSDAASAAAQSLF